MFNISKENKGFGALEFVYNGAVCIFLGYCVMYFKSIGYSGTRIGVIMSSTVVLTMMSQIVSGYLNDYFISVKKILTVDLFISLFAVLAMPFASNYFVLIFILFSVLSLTGRVVLSLVDSYVAKLSKTRSGLDYGFVRGFGSLGYAITAFFGGLMIDKFGVNSIFILHTVLIIISLFILFTLEDVPIQNRKETIGNKSFVSAAIQLFKTRGFLMATLASAATFIGVNLIGTYISIVIIDLGGTSSHVGIAIFLSAVSEAPIMWNYYRLLRKFTNRQMLMFAFVMFVVKIFGVTVFFSVEGILFFQLFQSVSFGLYMPSMMRYMSSIIPEKLLSTGIMLWVAIYGGISGIVGSFAGGYLFENLGVLPMYYISAGCSLAGAVLMAFTLLITKDKVKQ